jgi:hypothetical protein
MVVVRCSVMNRNADRDRHMAIANAKANRADFFRRSSQERKRQREAMTQGPIKTENFPAKSGVMIYF